MSEDNSIINDEQPGSAEQEQPKFVSKDAYEGVSKDMHKFKSKAKEAEARANEFQSKLKAIEEEGLKEKQQWEELYHKTTAELEQEREISRTKDEKLMNTLKKNALKQELGNRVKDEYLNFANIDAIEFDENGHLVKESLQSVANNFRQEHSLLIPTNPNANPTGMSPNLDGNVVKPKPLKDMSMAERVAAIQAIRDKSEQ